jgi:hypothetical protein
MRALAFHQEVLDRVADLISVTRRVGAGLMSIHAITRPHLNEILARYRRRAEPI